MKESNKSINQFNKKLETIQTSKRIHRRFFKDANKHSICTKYTNMLSFITKYIYLRVLLITLAVNQNSKTTSLQKVSQM